MSCKEMISTHSLERIGRVKTHILSLINVFRSPCKLRFSAYESLFSIAFAHSFFHTLSTASAHMTGYVVGGLKMRQFWKTSSTSLANSSMVEYLPSFSLFEMVPKSIGSLISS